MENEKQLWTDFIAPIAKQTGLTQSAVKSFLNSISTILEEALLADGIVKVNGLGTFKLQAVAPRRSVDVNTGAAIVIEGYNKVTFLPEASVKTRINKPFALLQPVELQANAPLKKEELEPVGEADALATDAVDPLARLGEQAVEIKDLLSEINGLGNMAAAPAPVEPGGSDELPQDEESAIVPEPETEPTAVQKPPLEPASPATTTENIVSPAEVVTQPIPTPMPVAASVPPTASNTPIEEPQTTAKVDKKGMSWWKIAGIIVLCFCVLLLILYVLLQYKIVQWSKQYLQQPQPIEIPAEPAKPQPDTLLLPIEEDLPATDPAVAETPMAKFEQPRTYTEFVGTETIGEGSRLAWIAKKYYGAADFWVYIYEANRNVIANPDQVKVGTTVRVPKLPAYLTDASDSLCMAYARSLHDEYVKR